jgi:LPXTG-site transpeptidase (sortase) family protein
MSQKPMRLFMTLIYIVMIVLNSTSLLFTTPVPVMAAESVTAGPTSAGPDARPQGAPSACLDATNDPNVGIQLWGVNATSPILSSTVIIDNLQIAGGYSGPAPRIAPGETILIETRITNTGGETLTNVMGEMHIGSLASVIAIIPATWTDWSGKASPSEIFDGTLAPGEWAQALIEYTAQPTDPIIVDYTWFAWGNYTDGIHCDPDTASANNIMFRVEGPGVSVNVSTVPFVEVGSTIQWNVSIINNRPLPTTINSIDDLYFEAEAFGECKPDPTSTLDDLAGGVPISLPNLNDYVEFSFECTMQPYYPDPVENTVTVNATASGISGDFSGMSSTAKASPSIKVYKFANVDEAAPGDTVVYTIRVENDGNTDLLNVTVVDTLTGILTGVPSTLAAGAFYQDTVEYVVRESDSDPLINIVTAIGVSPQGITVGDNWTESIDKTNPALQLTMNVVPTQAAAGEAVTYNFQVANTSTEGLVNVGLDFPLCGGPITLGSTSLVPGGATNGSCTYTIVGDENDPFGFTAATTATATARTAAGTNISDSASVFVDILSSQLQVSIVADREIALRGDTITYTVSVQNPTGTDLTLNSITSNLLGAIGNIPPSGTVIPGGGAITPFNVEYTVSGTDPDPLVHIVTAEATLPDTSTVSDSASEITDVSDAQMFITVTADPPDAQSPLESVDYSVGISNIGRVTLTDVTGYFEVAGTGTAGTPIDIDFPDDGLGPTQLPGVLAPFESAFSAFSRTVQSSDPDPLTVVVYIVGYDDQGTERTFTGTATIDVLPAQLRVNKVGNVTAAVVGDRVTYEFFVENVSDTSEIIDNVSLEDSLCAMAVSGCSGNNVLLVPYDPDTGPDTGATPAITIGPLNPPPSINERGDMAYGIIEYDITVADANLPEALLINRAIVTGTQQSNGASVGDADEWEIQIGNPLELEKVSTSVVTTIGSCVSYQFSVRNLGQLNDIENLELSDPRIGLLATRSQPLVPGDIWRVPPIGTAPTGDCSGVGEYPVTAGDAPVINNTANVTGTVNGQSVSSSSNWSIEVSEPIVVEKLGASYAIIGDEIQYIVTITNVSGIDYTFVEASDTSNSSANPGPNPISILQLNANSDIPDPSAPYILEPGESTTYTYTYNVQPRDPDELVNVFEVVMSNGTENTPFTATYTVPVFSPFQIFKVPDRFFAVIGEAIHYDFLVYNISRIQMDQVILTDDHLGRIAVRSKQEVDADPNAPYTTALRSLPAAPVDPCIPPICDAHFLVSDPDPAANTYTVTPVDAESEILTNLLTVRGITGANPYIETGVSILTFETAEVQVGSPLSVVKTGVTSANRGDTISYTVSLTNTSPPASGIVVENIDAIDSLTGVVGLTFPNPPDRSLQPGQSATGTITLTVPENAPDPFVNTVTGTGEITIDPGTGPVTYEISALGSATVDLNDPLLEVVLSANTDTTERNTTITWFARITNNSPDTSVIDLLYADATGVDIGSISDCPTSIPANSFVDCSWDYTITDADPDPLANTLNVSGRTPGDTPVSASGEFIVDLVDLRFRVSKVAAPNVAFVGDTITYTITVTNSSDSTMTGVTAIDTLTGPVPLTFPSGIDGLLNNNESASGQVTYTLSQADPSPLVNQVSASGTTVSGGNILSDSTYTTVLISASQLLVEKQATPTIVQTGEQIQYNIAITNIGQTPLSNIRVYDPAVGLDTDVDPNTCGGSISYDGDTYNVNCNITSPLTLGPLDTLNPFEVAFVTYSVEATTDLPDPFVNAILAFGTDPEGNVVEGNDTIAVDIVTPGILLTKTADRAGAAIGDMVQYTIEVTNIGVGDLTNVQVIDNELGTPISLIVEGTPPAVTTIPVLAPGETARGIINYEVTASTPNPFVNTVTVTNSEGVTDGAAASIEIRDLGISVSKTAQVTSALIGETVTYDIEVTNTSNQTLTAVTAIDQLTGATIELEDPISGAVITELASGESAIGTFEYTVPPNAPDPLPNRVSASGRASSGVTVSSSALALVDIREADLNLSKTADTPIAIVGQPITYSFEIRNEGTSVVTGVQLTDPLCTSAGPGECTGNFVNLTFPGAPGELAPGDTATGTLTHMVSAADPDPLVNTAQATGTAGSLTIQDTDSATVQIGASDLVLSKTVLGIGGCAAPVPATVAQVGDVVAYAVQATNIDADGLLDDITDIQVIDTLNGQDITNLLFPFNTTLGPAGVSQTACIEITVTDSSPDPLVNTVVATGLLGVAGVPITDTASASIAISGGDLVVTNVPSQATAQIGDTINFSVSIRNTGTSTLQNVTASSSQAGGTIALSTNVLSPGQTAFGSYTYTVTGFDADPLESTVLVTADAPGPITLSDTATASIDLVSPGVRITKTALPSLAVYGTDIAYNITVTNTGAENITGFTVTDLLLGGDITGCFDPGVPLPTPAPTCTPPGVSPLPLPPGASLTATITRTLSSGDGDPSINTVAVEATTATTTLTDTASARVNVAGSGLNVVKRADVAAATDGDIVTYTLEITNTSTTPVTGLTITDTLVPSLTPPRSSLDIGESMAMTYTHTVNGALDSDPLINEVIVAGRDGLGITVSDSSSATVAILDNANIRVTVIPDQPTVLAGQAVNYLATITNIGMETLSDVSATATLPDGTIVPLTLSTNVLLSGQSVTATFSYTVDVSDTAPVIATVTGEGELPSGDRVSDTGAASLGITISSIDVSLRTVGCGIPCVAVVGDTLEFRATVTNDGATLLSGISLTSPLPLQTTDPTTGLILLPGETAAVEYTYTVPLNVPAQLNIPIIAEGTDPVPTTVTDQFEVRLDTANPRIGVTLSPDRTIVPQGDTITYTAQISNSGTETLQNIALIDSVVGSVTDQLSVVTLAPGETTTVIYTYIVGPEAGDPLVNTITVSAATDFGHTVADNDTTIINVQRPELFITISASPDIALVGERIGYTVTVINIGDGPIYNLRGSYIADTEFATGGQTRPVLQGGIVLLGANRLDEGQATTGIFNHLVSSGDNNPLTFRVTISGEGLAGTTEVTVSDDALISVPIVSVDAGGNPIVVGTPIPGVADPEVVKSSDQPFAVPGGLVTWELTVRNPGTDPLSSIIITDTLDSKMTLESVSITNGTIESEGNAIVATTGTLEFNDAAVMTIVSRVNEGVIAGALLQNVGCATSVGGAASICSTATVRIAPDADLLPATGDAVPANTSSSPGWLGLVGLAILGLFLLMGMAMDEDPDHPDPLENPDRGMRLVIMAAMGAAIVVILTVIVALVLSLTGGDAPEQAAATATATVEQVVELPTATASEAPTITSGGPATSAAPTAIPIPTADGTLPPTLEPTFVPPFQPTSTRELFIPRLGLAEPIPIISIPLRNRTWDVRDLGQSIGFLQGTTWIDEAGEGFGGNTVLAGHIQIRDDVPGPFRDLDLLEVGDSVFVADEGIVQEFEVFEVDVVEPHDITVTYPTGDQTLTLLTCTTWNAFRGVFAERLIVRARPLRSMSY